MATFEASFPLDGAIGDAIKDALESLRGVGAARCVGITILTDEQYEDWYKDGTRRLSEVEIPFPTVVRFD